MKNNTASEVVISMKHIDNAHQLAITLIKAQKVIGYGGDVHLIVKVNGTDHDCGCIGHDVVFRGIEHRKPAS
jgi:hypothetical protein